MPFRFRQPRVASQSPARPLPAEGREAGSIGAAAAALVALFLVLLSVFVYLSRLNRGPVGAGPSGTPPAGPGPVTQGEDAPPEVTALPIAGPPAAAPGGAFLDVLSVLTVGAADAYQTHRDEAWSYELLLPGSWEAATVAATGQRLAEPAHDRVLQEPATGARLALSVWDAADEENLTLQAWAERVAPGLSPVGDSWEPNATVAGEPALCLWSAEAASQPLRLATLLRHGDRLYLLSYGAPDGGAALAHYVKALVSLRFLDQDPAAGTADQIPLLPLPDPRYYPSGLLFP